MNRMMKRVAAGLCMVLTVGLLAGCGGEDKVGYVDMSRIQKEAPLAQQYRQKTEDKGKELNNELQQAQQSMSAEDFQKKKQQIDQESQIYAASMQRQFQSELETKAGEIAKEKEIGIIVYKEVIPSGGIDVTDDMIAKLQ